MKTYIYTTSTGRNHQSGGRTRTFNVMRLKHNIPNDLGMFKVNTASYSGDFSSVMKYAINKDGLSQSERLRVICVGEF